MNNCRRLLVVLGVVALTTPLASFAQLPRELPRVGYLLSQNPDYFWEMFQRDMRDLGYIDSRNIVFERRNAEGRLDKMPALVREFLEQKVQVLIAPNNVAIEAARKATATIPIVMMTSIDPVAAGLWLALPIPVGTSLASPILTAT
jgi:putative ABC transport system substrate-binding protein